MEAATVAVKALAGELVEVRYVGVRAKRRDTLCGTKAVWDAPGAVQQVPPLVAKQLLKHPDVWQLAEAPWEPPAPVMPAADLGALVQAGRWAEIAGLEPQVFARAQRYFGIGEAVPWRLPDDLVDAWAQAVLAGSEPQIRERLEAQQALLTAHPSLFDALGHSESAAGKNRRGVIDLLLGEEARAASGPAQLPGMAA